MDAPYTAGIPEDLQVELADCTLEAWLIFAHDIRADLSEEQLTVAWQSMQALKRRKGLQ